MDDELTRAYRRWLEADEHGTEDEADAACLAVFQTVGHGPEEAAPLAFAARTMEAIAKESARDVWRAKQTRRVLTIGGIVTAAVAGYFGAGIAASALGSIVVALFDLLIALVVNGAERVQAGAGLWTLTTAMGRAASAFVSDPKVTFVLLVLQALAVGALVTLQRLLGPDGESFK